jgi:import receptor subunit TOM70
MALIGNYRNGSLVYLRIHLCLPTLLLSDPVRIHAFGHIHVLTALYFSGARPIAPTNDCAADSTLHLALDALDAGDYPHAVSLINEALEQGISWDEGKAEALNLRGTFK